MWQDALVMQDMQTKSLWSQVTGECIQGELEGKSLSLFPSQHTTFAEFKERFPEGVLLKKPFKGPRGSAYQDYFSDSAKLGIFGRQDTFKQIPGKTRVFGLRFNDGQVALTVDHMEVNRIEVIDMFNPKTLLYYDSEGETVSAYALPENIAWDPAQFKVRQDQIVYRDNRFAWNSSTGEGISDDMPDLKPMPVITAYWFAWFSFFTDTRLIK